VTNILHPEIVDNYVREQAAEFEKEDVTVTLEWDELNPLYSVNVSVTPEAQVNIFSSTARLRMAYNVTYNVNVMVSHLCEQNSVTVFTEVYIYYYFHSTGILMNAHDSIFVSL
jgi:DNA integrity scanning protein DisA with diadenylate cyclase activity